ncbi:energy-coupling factor ABC transporter permease [Streptomyces sp. 549]|uniref:energy-coupling factor ABC transporter permease n=1 Tax=Streptomyces sp. 549 TaxID=3049076 RepID=UPI0024C3213A|nr:energy-coupling factor ABC transporter permease [Streptomyces sp. 549]MDK1476028.1 energy-coupling factor ABC transporter permease [Streptomyces sp. 549]
MHVPDGFFNAPVSVATGVVAAAAVAVSLRGARRELDERVTPLAGLVAAFVFAVQMLNFPVGAGTSGHLMGGALAAILVGPYTAVLCLTVVLLMQALLFADGGLTALGTNVTLLGVVAVAVAYPLFRLLARSLPRGRRSLTASSFVAALVSVPVAAMVFTVLFALGGTADVSLGKVFAAMVGVHTAIGLGEAAITALTVGAVLAVRPDLVYGARDLVAAPLVLRTAPGTPAATTPAAPAATGPTAATDPASATDPATAPAAGRRSVRPLWLAGLAATLVCAGVVSYYASSELDGLERVSTDQGFIDLAEDHALEGSPLADYGVREVEDERISVGLAGVIGVGATLAVGTGVFLVVRRREAREAATADEKV